MSVKGSHRYLPVAVIGSILIATILIFGTIWTGHKAKQDTEKAVRSVSLLYLDELTGRREQVVATALKKNISDLKTAVGLMEEEDLDELSKLQAYQSRMKKLYTLEKFAFVDNNGLIYTSTGIQDNIEDYNIDYKNINKPQISIKDEKSEEKKVIIAIPVKDMLPGTKGLSVCFMEIAMNNMLEGVSLKANNNTTFCNIYTKDGVALTNMVLGGLASEDNLLSALEKAEFENNDTCEKVKKDFAEGTGGTVSFTYTGIRETLAYTNIAGTDWMLTYLIRETVISSQIGGVSKGIITRSLVQTVFTVAILLIMFFIIYKQNKQAIALAIEKETSETENRIKREELEGRLELQERLLEQEKLRTRQDFMISALASDYRSVYYAQLDSDECICYRSSVEKDRGPQVGDKFSFRESFGRYAAERVAEPYREEFLHFIEPENIRKGLENEQVITYRYLIREDERESYEMLRIAGVAEESGSEESGIHTVSVGFTDIDTQMREQMAQSQVLSDALTTAEQASKAKTAFLSSMSHEIRTPINAIIGLDNIALHDETISPKTREFFEKIGTSATHLLEIINDILDMSKIESGKMVLKNEEFSFSKLLEQINTIFSGQCSDKGLKYNCGIKGQVEEYYIGDATKLKQILINILGNAVKFTPEGGNVDLQIETVANFEKNSTLRFSVSDTGIGMSSDYLPHIFDSFSQEDSSATNKYGSSGLGLAITKNIVEMMNGNIDVKSEKGKGTVFTFTLTLTLSEHTSTNEEFEIDPKKMEVLVIDDDAVACEHAKLVLENAGISCETAISGQDAIEMVKERDKRKKPYQLILVDLKMPGMDGIETTKRIRAIVGAKSAIIIITAYRWEDVLDEAEKAGVDSFIAKPLFANTVLEEFTSALKRREQVSEKKTLDLAGKRILLAEDISINAEIMTTMLTMNDIRVECAENGKQAVDMFSSSEEGYYSAILMDIRMPEMDGLEATKLIRKLNRADAEKVPIIALTANAFDEDIKRSLQSGMNAHLSKPIDEKALFETLYALIV
ncbi:MAG: response regulator [Firmicutes bacterium]|nr:response regulator [Bacillota bacterium]